MNRSEKALQRAVLTKSGVIDTRNLSTGHKRLAQIVKPGMTVLDIGCGTGAITSGIAKAVGPSGTVVGLDNNSEWIAKANQQYAGVSNCSFVEGNIYDLPYQDQFDVVTAARVLQWLDRPHKALEQMVKAVKPGGIVLVLDYNHEKIEWTPPVPESMTTFYESFLKWRADAGMDNAIADHLAEMFAAQGMVQIQVNEQHEVSTREQVHFQTQTMIWAGVAEFKGLQMVQDGYLSDQQRALAEAQYKQWIEVQGEYQKMYLLSVEGMKEGR